MAKEECRMQNVERSARLAFPSVPKVSAWPLPSSFIILPSLSMILGIEIGGTKLQVVLGDEAGKIGERRMLHVDQARGAGGIRTQIEKAVGELTQGRPILRAGVGF